MVLLESGCSWLGDVRLEFEGRAAPSYLFLTGESQFKPSVATPLPLRTAAPTEPVIPLEKCGMTPQFSYNRGYHDPLFEGTWLSQAIWVDLRRGNEDPVLLPFRLYQVLHDLQMPFASIRFSELQLLTLDTNETSYRFIQAHPDWGITEYVSHFGRCLPEYGGAGLHTLHQAVYAQLEVKVRGFVGLAIPLSEEKRKSLESLGFKYDPGNCSFKSAAPWLVVRTSRLRLNSVGVFVAASVN